MSSSPVAVVFGAATDVGRRRSLNEDSFLASAPVFVVADGMGGHSAGEIASAIAVEELARLAGRPSLTVADVHETIRQARTRIDALPAEGGAGAGTTLAGIAVAEVDGEGHWLVMNLGDSRTYRLRGGELVQVSVDHSVVQELLDAGQLDAASAAQDSRRNVITRALGAGSDGEPDFWLLPAHPGDRILVCSDGLSNEVDDERIRSVLRSESRPQAAAERLVREAVDAGGRDNVTAVVVDAIAVRVPLAQRPAARAPEPHPEDRAVEWPDEEFDGDTLPRARARSGASG